ncbi:MAG: YdcF family protein [Elusimicrobiota bacterium]
MKKNNRFARRGVRVLLATAVLLALAGLVPLSLGLWIDFSEEPTASDIIVVLSGGYTRAPYAAELYAKRFAPEIWISRPRPPSGHIKLADIGVPLPAEESVNQQVLLKMGVPKNRIRFFGFDVISTADEAAALRREFPFRDKDILIVTSRFHARRARLTFQRALPGARVRVTATPYENATRLWWTDKELASNSILEACKLAYFLVGGRMKR